MFEVKRLMQEDVHQPDSQTSSEIMHFASKRSSVRR